MAKISVLTKDFDDSLLNRTDPIVYLPKVAAPFTTVVKRALMTDLANDLLPRFGVERVMLQSIQEVQGESGPNGERVFKPINDQHDAMRIVGSIVFVNSGDGQGFQISQSSDDYVEITFYGTGLNIMARHTADNRSVSLTVDGVAGSTINYSTTSNSPILNGRNYSSNAVTNLVSGLALGLHTVKILASTSNTIFHGYEVLNTNSTIQLLPGRSYLGGKRLYSSSLTTSSPTSGFTNIYGTAGTRGSHVLVYQKPDGTIAKDIRYTETAAAYLASSSHTNEDIIRIYSWREFGAGRSDDFSLASGGPFNKVFTLDDGTTTLVGSQIDVAISLGDLVRLGTLSGFVTITFIGTGLDWVSVEDSAGTRDTLALSVDGISQGNLPASALASQRIEKLCSGLPYGTHTVKILLSVAGTVRTSVKQFIVYGPSKPALPAGCVELADYYTMADYTPTTTYGNASVVSPGVIRKMLIREAVYSGTWAIASLDTSFASSFNVRSNTNASYVEYTFVGTGLEFRPLLSNAAYNFTFQIDGAGATGSTFTYTGSGLTYVPSTGALTGTAAGTVGYAGGLWSVNNLTFGVHKFRVTWNTGASDFLYADAFNIITPVHSPKINQPGDLQNVLPVGSCAIGDSRKFSSTSVKTLANWAQAIGLASGPTTTSTSFVPVPDMSVSIKTSGNPVQVAYNVASTITVAGQTVDFIVYIDGVSLASSRTQLMPSLSGYRQTATCAVIVPLAAGFHKIDVYWVVSGNTATAVDVTRQISVMEI